MNAYCLDTSAYSNEVRTGFLLGRRRRRSETVLGAILRTLWYDIWIAATAARNGSSVLTCNAHFERIARVGSVIVGA